MDVLKSPTKVLVADPESEASDSLPLDFVFLNLTLLSQLFFLRTSGFPEATLILLQGQGFHPMLDLVASTSALTLA